jgi:hypothetical protein
VTSRASEKFIHPTKSIEQVWETTDDWLVDYQNKRWLNDALGRLLPPCAEDTTTTGVQIQTAPLTGEPTLRLQFVVEM